MKECNRRRKRVTTFFMTLLIILTACLPSIMKAFPLTDAQWKNPLVVKSWDDTLAREFDVTAMGLAFNGTSYPKIQSGNNFTFSAVAHLI